MNTSDDESDTSLDAQIVGAAAEGRVDELAHLLDAHPEKLSITGGQWKTPLLHLAAEHGRLDCVEEILRRGFDPSTRDRLDNATAMHWAAQSGISQSSTACSPPAPTSMATLTHTRSEVIGCGDLLQARSARGRRASVNARRDADDLSGRSARPRRSRTSIGRRRPRSAHSQDEPVRTTPHTAASRGAEEPSPHGQTFARIGGRSAAKDDRGNTPLNYTASNKDQTIAEILLAGGADPAQRDVNRFESLIPIFGVRDMAAAIGYYEAKLGFHKEWAWGDPPTFACVMRDETRLFLSQVENPSRATVYVTVNERRCALRGLSPARPERLEAARELPLGQSRDRASGPRRSPSRHRQRGGRHDAGSGKA